MQDPHRTRPCISPIEIKWTVEKQYSAEMLTVSCSRHRTGESTEHNPKRSFVPGVSQMYQEACLCQVQSRGGQRKDVHWPPCDTKPVVLAWKVVEGRGRVEWQLIGAGWKPWADRPGAGVRPDWMTLARSNPLFPTQSAFLGPIKELHSASRGINSLYPGLCCSRPQLHSGY